MKFIETFIFDVISRLVLFLPEGKYKKLAQIFVTILEQFLFNLFFTPKDNLQFILWVYYDFLWSSKFSTFCLGKKISNKVLHKHKIIYKNVIFFLEKSCNIFIFFSQSTMHTSSFNFRRLSDISKCYRTRTSCWGRIWGVSMADSQIFHIQSQTKVSVWLYPFKRVWSWKFPAMPYYGV